MARNSKAKAATASNLGKGKVTPVQIAFIVERFLADNNYTNTLSAFRSEASELFSKTKGKEVPKGLLGLADILDEYISLKEHRLMVDQEKRRVEMAFQGFQDVMRAYQHSVPQSPLLLPHQDQIATANPSSGSPQGQMLQGSSIIKNVQTPTVPLNIEETNNFSTPMPNCSSSHKRKALKSAPKAPPPPKKSRAESAKDSRMIRGGKLSAETPCTNNTQANAPAFQSSSIAKTLFKNPSDAQSSFPVQDSYIGNSPETGTTSSSPKTPPQALQCQTMENSSINVIGASNSQKAAPSSCSIISSSERIIISPFKHKGYYAVERSYCVSTSPMKSNFEKSNKREHVKGRLDFEESVAPQSSGEQLAAAQSSPSADAETAGSFDFDLPDFDFFDGDISKLLVDMDFECEQIHSSQQSSVPADLLPGCNLEQNVGNGCVGTNQDYQGLPESYFSHLSQKNMDIQGLDTVTTMRSITKRIMISSPSKASSSNSSRQSDSSAKS